MFAAEETTLKIQTASCGRYLAKATCYCKCVFTVIVIIISSSSSSSSSSSGTTTTTTTIITFITITITIIISTAMSVTYICIRLHGNVAHVEGQQRREHGVPALHLHYTNTYNQLC